MSEQLISIAKKLSLFTIIYNVIEGVVSIYFGVEEDSVSLFGFGMDSFLEVVSASIVFIKLKTSNPDTNLKNERKETFAIGVLFILLSIFVFLGSAGQLAGETHPETTLPGIIVSLVSLSLMFFLWRAKAKVGFQLNSSTVTADAKCSLACIKLSFVLLTGSLLFRIFPSLWWVDSVAAIVIGLFIFLEGKELISSSRKDDFQGGCGCH